MKTFKQFLEQESDGHDFVWRVTFPKGGTSKWQSVRLPFTSVQEIYKVVTDRTGDQGFITGLLKNTLGLPSGQHGFEPEDYSPLNQPKGDETQIDIEVRYNLFHRREDGLQVAKLSIQED
jgi:hypothetical protein